MSSAQALSSWQSCRLDSAPSSPLEQLPPELLVKILQYVTFPSHSICKGYNMPRDPNASIVKEQVSLLPTLVTSRRLSSIAITLMYRDPKISSQEILDTVVQNITADPRLGRFIRRLDLCRMTSARNVLVSHDRNVSLLSNLLTKAPLLQELYIDQNLGTELDQNGFQAIFGDLKQLHTLHVTDCESQQFTNALVAVSHGRGINLAALRNLSLRKCSNLSVEDFLSILSLLSNLRDLDVSNTRVDAEALQCIPRSARIQRLNLSHCTHMTGQELASFLSRHPAVRDSLVSLDLSLSPEERTIEETDLSAILSDMPPTIKSLSLGNCRSSSSHIPLLQNLHGNLRYLTVGSGLLLRDVETIVLSPAFQFATASEEEDFLSIPSELKYQSVLSSMEKVVAICKLRQRIDSIVPRSDGLVTRQSKLQYLNITSLSIPEQSKIGCSVLLSKSAWPLAVIEISNTVLLWNEMLSNLCEALGWKIRSVEKRCWLDRRVDAR